MRNFVLYLACLSAATAAMAQQYTITTVAGKGAFSGDGGPAAAASLSAPRSVTVDSAGSVYIADSGNNRIRKVDASGKIHTIAGTGRNGVSGDGGPAVAADINGPGAIFFDNGGAIFFADEYYLHSTTGFARVRRISPNGIITTIAGKPGTGALATDPSGLCKPSGDGGSAQSATLCYVTAFARDSQGNFYIADSNTVRKFTLGGSIATIAGTGKYGYLGDGGPAAQATFSSIVSLATDNNGNIYVADAGNYAIRKIDASHMISTVVHTTPNISLNWVHVDAAGALFYSSGNIVYKVGNGTDAVIATLTDNASAAAAGIAFDSSGNLYVADSGSNTVDKFSGGVGVKIVGNPQRPFASAGPAFNAQIPFVYPGLAADSAGNLYLLETAPVEATPYSYQYRIDKVTAAGTLVPLLGPSVQLPTGDPALPQTSLAPGQIAVDPSGSAVYFTNGFFSAQIYKLTPDGKVTRYAGRRASQKDDGDGGLAINAGIHGITGMAVDHKGNLYVAEESGNVVRKIDAAGVITTYAGVGISGFSGDGGRAIDAKLSYPLGLAVDAEGNLFIADYQNHRVRKVNTQGVISTIAGGKFGFSGDGGPATSAAMVGPIGVAVDPAGNVFFSDTATNLIPAPIVIVPYPANNRIRMVGKSGIITTAAGSGTGGGDVGDGGPATSAELSEPAVMAADAAGNIYFHDLSNQKIRRLTPSTVTLGSAASFAYGAQAAESIVSAYGSDLANTTATATGAVGTTLGGTTVTIRDSAAVDHSAGLFYVGQAHGSQPGQVNFEIPAGTAAGNGTITIKSGDGTTSTAPILVSHVSPGIFALNGASLVAAQVLYVHADNSQTFDKIFTVQNGAVVAKPINLAAAPGDKVYLLIYGTGIRGAGTAGTSVTINGVNAKVLFAGAQGSFVGEDQVNVAIPSSLAGAGDVPLVLTADGQVANIVRLTIH